jgi:hypothetical protein
MAPIDVNKEMDDFLEDKEKSKGKNLRILVDELPMSKYELGTLKLSDIEPVYLKKKVFSIDTSVKESRHKLF